MSSFIFFPSVTYPVTSLETHPSNNTGLKISFFVRHLHHYSFLTINNRVEGIAPTVSLPSGSTLYTLWRTGVTLLRLVKVDPLRLRRHQHTFPHTARIHPWRPWSSMMKKRVLDPRELRMQEKEAVGTLSTLKSHFMSLTRGIQDMPRSTEGS